MSKFVTLCLLVLLCSCVDLQEPKEVTIYRPSSYSIPLGQVGPGNLTIDAMIGSVSIKKKYVDIGPSPGGHDYEGFRPEKFTPATASNEAPGIGGEGMVIYYRIPFN